jgi:hypothetical protein
MSDCEQRLHELAREYLGYVSLMQTTDLRDDDRRYLSSQRTVVHDQLIELTGLARPFNMVEYCSDLLGGRRRAVFADTHRITDSPEYRAMDKAQMLIEDADRYMEGL